MKKWDDTELLNFRDLRQEFAEPDDPYVVECVEWCRVHANKVTMFTAKVAYCDLLMARERLIQWTEKEIARIEQAEKNIKKP
jgi:hypothetical protein